MSKYQRVVSDFHHGKYFSFRKGHSSPFGLLRLTQTISGLRNPGRRHWNSLRCYCSRCRSCSHCRSCCCCCSTENAPTNSQWTAGIPKADRFYRNTPNFYDLVSKAQFSLVDIISGLCRSLMYLSKDHFRNQSARQAIAPYFQEFLLLSLV